MLSLVLVVVMITGTFVMPTPVQALDESGIHLQPVSGVSTLAPSDLNTLTATLGTPVGLQGFEGNYALGAPHELVDIVVQFITPPSVALRLMQEHGISHARSLSGQSFEEHALQAHTAFLQQLERLPQPFGMEPPEIYSTHYRLFNGVGMRVSTGMVESIANLPEVFSVFPDVMAYMPETEMTAGAVPSAAAAPMSTFTYNNEARALFDIYHIHYNLGFTGAGVRVAVIDSGVNYLHPSLAAFQCPVLGRIRGQNFAPEVPPDNLMDIHGHGTHVSGTIVAMAPDVELWHFRISVSINAPHTRITSSVEAAHAEGLDVINISWQLSNSIHLLTAVNLAILDGIVIVIGTGNDGQNFSTINLGAHAGLPIMVANGTAGGAGVTIDRVNPSSSRGPVPSSFRIGTDITAPGFNILSVGLGDTYIHKSGTSMATPAVSGIAALLAEAFPNARPYEIRARLMNTARPLEDMFDDPNDTP
jgi:subtilisin family serine protease